MELESLRLSLWRVALLLWSVPTTHLSTVSNTVGSTSRKCNSSPLATELVKERSLDDALATSSLWHGNRRLFLKGFLTVLFS